MSREEWEKYNRDQRDKKRCDIVFFHWRIITIDLLNLQSHIIRDAIFLL